MSEISAHEDVELQEIPHGPSPLIQVLREAARRMGLSDSSSISGAMLPQQHKIDNIFNAMIFSSDWLGPPHQWQYATFMAGMVSDTQLALGWGVTTRRDMTPGIQSNCAFYAKFLELLLGAVGIEDTEIVSVSRPGEMLVTRRLGQAHPNVTGAFRCIDPGVTGNVRREHGTFALEGRCCFSGHVALRVGNRVYDPTLQAIYANGIQDCIDFWVFADPLRDGLWFSHDRPPHQRQLKRLPNEQSAGFGATYLLS